MAKYIGVKVIEAVMMSRAEWLHSRCLPFDEVDVHAAGYRVTYPDFYVSWCPKATFEEANRPTTGMPFGHAIEALRKGLKVARAGWNGKGMWLLLQVPDAHSKMSLPYLYIEYPAGHVAYPNGSRVPWLASQTDMLADDWMVVE